MQHKHSLQIIILTVFRALGVFLLINAVEVLLEGGAPKKRVVVRVVHLTLLLHLLQVYN